MKNRVLVSSDLLKYTFPILLPSKNVIVERMIELLHLEHKHTGTQTLLMILRERVWIIKGRKTIRSVVKRCITCQRYAIKALEVPLPPLPEERKKLLKTFQLTGIDLAGPVFFKGNLKACIVIFTCAVFRAVYLELITSLSTNVFIDAFKRFISRRGRVEVIYSDNGSNFIGLNKAMNELDWADIESRCALMKIKWKFNPPTTSWWGGFWERLIRILKDLLRKNLRHACLGYEEFLTLLCEGEGLMNNRPLIYLSEEGDDLSPLKPSMFLQNLIGSNVYDLYEINSMSIIERWKYLQRVREGLRNRFRKE
ncbi:uncharacterized protein LOC118205308 [Stegodyphus dumicola]|uniref:uncharacterized protein LOC118205308 n=1 Tax=Stegodyphus dumicola TaxID=202533 RepID=UPI0015AD8E5B|nr:uncharacterized protein LOC118205308 [Stegodyphus dumicola]